MECGLVLREAVDVPILVVGPSDASRAVRDVQIQRGIVVGLTLPACICSVVSLGRGHVALSGVTLVCRWIFMLRDFIDLLPSLRYRAEDLDLVVLTDVLMACLHILLLHSAPDPTAYDADVLLDLLIEGFGLLDLLLQLHSLDERLLELSARHERAHVMETNRRLLCRRVARSPRWLLQSPVIL